jgi:hypothetical protein
LMAFTGMRAVVMRFAARHPRLLTMGVPVWRALRPPVVRRRRSSFTGRTASRVRPAHAHRRPRR